ncbi:MAG: YifB family Mg chelatase-like AAA ATPase [Acidaminococcus sp.]|jgi:magnesium chelatase family protein|nr:YifB family Mg chelatase-like AAA ATPase [Acidaminococcus sp.]MCI2099953.1 YifB family Mg chelatase-like AAA ATPase [Acidaminococcus sp.]MCI2114184.1 YifB family Mg chelatase-like AAA ATPase [Acidaminococcus sp.]
MYARIWGETTCGINGEMIAVEVDISRGEGIDIVGLADTAIKESRERVRAATRNSGFHFPKAHCTVNLAPADLKKDGSGLDLPIAVGFLAAQGQVRVPEENSPVFIGELALDGGLRPVNGILPMILRAREEKREAIYIPSGNAEEGSLVDGIKVYTADSLQQIVAHLKDGKTLKPLVKSIPQVDPEVVSTVDFAEVQGQVVAKRALEIAAAGGHNVLMVGAPGAGKTMLARRLPTILPPMTEEEALEVTKIYSISGLMSHRHGIVMERPFRSPHHTISNNALIGGGSIPKPGEVTLSHHGVLFLDELPEFTRSSLEALRQPLEDRVAVISRVQATISFPADFILVAAQNPCPCGFWGENDGVHECTCSPGEIERYHKKISGPLLDRIDIQIHVPRLQYQEMQGTTPSESSASIRKRVVAARTIQRERLKGLHIFCNAGMGRKEIKKFCPLTDGAQKMLEQYFTALGLSARSHDRIIKVARTVADLDHSEVITETHLSEAIQLRTSIRS